MAARILLGNVHALKHDPFVFGKKHRRRRGLHRHSQDPDRANKFFLRLGILIVLCAGGYMAYDYHQSQLESAAETGTPSAGVKPTPQPAPAAPANAGRVQAPPKLDGLDQLKLAAASQPEDANRWFELAAFYRKKENFPEAKAAYRMALRLMPDDFFLNVSYRMFLIECGEEEVLTARLQDFQESGEAMGPDWQIVQAAIAEREGNKDNADVVWQNAIASLPPELVQALLQDPMLEGFR